MIGQQEPLDRQTDELRARYKILHVLGTARVEGTGIVRIVASLASGLDRDRYTLHACFLNGAGPLAAELERAGVSVFSADWSCRALDPVGAGRFWRAIRAGGFAIVHIHFGGRLVQWLARSSGSYVIFHAHGFVSESDAYTSAPIRADAAHAAIACSRAVAARVVGTRAQVVYAGVPVPAFNASEAMSRAGRRSGVIGAAGRLVPIKGFQYLVRAFASICREFPNWRLEIAGSGPEHASLAEEIRDLRLERRVVLCGWRDQLKERFDNWDLYVQPSLKEGVPIAALEAMACGLPVVASKVGGLPELIEDGVTGWLVEPANEEALAERIRWMLINSEARTFMARAARACVQEKFSDRRMVSEISKVYDTLISTGHKRVFGAESLCIASRRRQLL